MSVHTSQVMRAVSCCFHGNYSRVSTGNSRIDTTRSSFTVLYLEEGSGFVTHFRSEIVMSDIIRTHEIYVGRSN